MSLIRLTSSDTGRTFNLPSLPEEIYDVLLIENKDEPIQDLVQVFPLADSEVYKNCSILNVTKLTSGDDVKEVYQIELPSHDRKFQPGDTIGIIPCNTNEDLSDLYRHLKITNLVHKKCKVKVKNRAIKMKLLPCFIDSTTTLHMIFSKCLDIRCLPKKSLIRVMAEYTKDNHEKSVLEELCSKEGAQKYEEEVLEKNKTFIDLLKRFPSCCPPVERLLENLPQLTPRPYSIASSPLATLDRLKIIFSVVKSGTNENLRTGLCTGMLKEHLLNRHNECNENRELTMYFRKSNGFRLPETDKKPLILIGPGTGIAPFLGFLEHRKIQNSKGTIWLFYGCCYKSKDFLCESELKEYLENGALTKLITSFSRDPGQEVKYVQDNIKKHGKEICDMIFDSQAIVYVCGDAKGMRKDVMDAFNEILQEHRGFNQKDAVMYMRNMQKEKRYLQDVWL